MKTTYVNTILIVAMPSSLHLQAPLLLLLLILPLTLALPSSSLPSLNSNQQLPLTTTHARPSCVFFPEVAFHHPCGRISETTAAHRYQTAHLESFSRRDCAAACSLAGADHCSSLSYADGRCVLFTEQAFYLKDPTTDEIGPLYDIRCFRCS